MEGLVLVPDHRQGSLTCHIKGICLVFSKTNIHNKENHSVDHVKTG